jgi:hypothetical protein
MPVDAPKSTSVPPGLIEEIPFINLHFAHPSKKEATDASTIATSPK